MHLGPGDFIFLAPGIDINHDYKSAEYPLGSEQWIASFADGLYEQAREAVLDSIAQIERLDPGNRPLVWLDRTPLSFNESVEKIINNPHTIPSLCYDYFISGGLKASV